MEPDEPSQHLFIVNKNHTMAPTLRYGDVARLEACEVSQINPGDVICFYRSLDHGWISRVVSLEARGLRTHPERQRGAAVSAGDGTAKEPLFLPFL
jgi:hypothetical protein